MIYVRKADARGHATRGWLESWHSFSFASYYDPAFMGFSALRVINEDIIEPGQGFGTHSHKDMEILTYVLSGIVEHQDSMGNKEQIPAGEFQIMSAGTGIQHSEYNPDPQQPLHLYQIWILPEKNGISPRYQQRRFSSNNGKQVILSPDERYHSLKIYQDMTLVRQIMSAGQQESIAVPKGRNLWIQVVRGEIELSRHKLVASDALAVCDESELSVSALCDAELLIFDLPPV